MVLTDSIVGDPVYGFHLLKNHLLGFSVRVFHCVNGEARRKREIAVETHPSPSVSDRRLLEEEERTDPDHQVLGKGEFVFALHGRLGQPS